METWTPHGLSLSCVTFDGEVGYGFLVIRAIDEQWAIYGACIWFVLEKVIEWLLLCPNLFCLLPCQLACK